MLKVDGNENQRTARNWSVKWWKHFYLEVPFKTFGQTKLFLIIYTPTKMTEILFSTCLGVHGK